jgi:hypothetical protein
VIVAEGNRRAGTVIGAQPRFSVVVVLALTVALLVVSEKVAVIFTRRLGAVSSPLRALRVRAGSVRATIARDEPGEQRES